MRQQIYLANGWGIAALLFFFLNASTHAEMGPCKPGIRDSIFCGSGNGAAFVIPTTISPSKRLALAWRTPNGPPTERPTPDNIELVLVRLADGATLATRKTEFWDIGETQTDQSLEDAFWSPNSRLMMRTFNRRLSHDIVEMYALGADDAVSATLDLLSIVGPAARARLKQQVNEPADYSFWIMAAKPEEEAAVTIDNRGKIRMGVMLWLPESGPYYYYEIKLRLVQTPGKLNAYIESITSTSRR